MTETVLDEKPRSFILLGSVSLLGLVLGIGVWGVSVEISGAIIVPGTVKNAKNHQIIQSQFGGAVSDLLVSEGTQVEAGDVLLRFDTTSQKAQLSFAREHLFDVMAQQERLQAEARGLGEFEFSDQLRQMAKTLPGALDILSTHQGISKASRDEFQIRRLQVAQEQAQARTQLTGLGGQIEALAVEFDLVREALRNQNNLVKKGLAPAQSVLALEREQAELAGGLAALRSDQAQTKERINALAIERLRLDSSDKSKALANLSEVAVAIRELRKELQQLAAEIRAAEVTAPVAGSVHQLSIQGKGAVARPAEPLMFLVPYGSVVNVQGRVPPEHIDRLHLGQAVTLRLSALDTTRSHELEGEVVLISSDVLIGRSDNQTFFGVTVEISTDALEQLPPDIRLLPGMPVEMFFRTQDRTALAYLVKPITDYFARAFRES